MNQSFDLSPVASLRPRRGDSGTGVGHSPLVSAGNLTCSRLPAYKDGHAQSGNASRQFNQDHADRHDGEADEDGQLVGPMLTLKPEELHPEYIIPSVFNPRVGKLVARAVRKAAIESGVCRKRSRVGAALD